MAQKHILHFLWSCCILWHPKSHHQKKHVLAKDASHVRISHGTFVCPGMGSRNWLRGDLPALGSFWFGESFSRIHWRTGQVSLYETILLMFCLSRWIPFQNKKSKWTESHENIRNYINILKITIATTTATSLKPPPAFVFTSICYKYFMNAGCLGVVAVASSPVLSAAGLAAGLAARLLPRLHLCLMETAISANWTSWIMNRYMISYYLRIKNKRLGKLEVEAYMYSIFLYIFVRYSL